MNFDRLTFALIGVVCAASSAQAASPAVPLADGFPRTERTRIYELSEVKRGDRGVGYTVFSGDRAEPFDVEVLGVMTAMVGPGQDVILARLSGPKIEFTGVISGMSGSPVFIDGRLVGAVAYRFGQFTREPIAGITPIRSMLALYSDAVGPESRATRSAWSPMSGPDHASQPHDWYRLERFRGRMGALPPWPLPNRQVSGALQPIDTPITVSGLDPAAIDTLQQRLAPVGFNVVAGGAGAKRNSMRFAIRNPDDRKVLANRADRAGTVPAAPIAPASPVAIVLMRGSLNASALCTVTMVERNTVYGCGHPFFGSGHVKFPMATAAVINTVASGAGSWKQSVAAREVGIINQDRLTAVAGQIGQAAPMVPVRVVVRRKDQPERKAVITDVEVVDSPIWMPLMAESAISSALNRRLGFEEGGTLELRAKVTVGRETLDLVDTFSAPPPARLGMLAARDVSTAAGILASNEWTKAVIRGIEVEAIVDPNVAVAQIRRVTPDRRWVRPGDRLGLTVELKPYRAPQRLVRMTVPIPKTAQKSVTVIVGGGLELDRRDSKAQAGTDPANLKDLIELLADRRPARVVFARVYEAGAGFRRNDTPLFDLPPTAQATLQSRASYATAVLKEVPGPEVQVVDPDVIVGSVELTIEVRP